MAIYHLSSQIIGRSGGKSAVASAAYRAGEKLQDQHIGQTFDYTKKRGVDHKEILAPDHAPVWVQDRGQLWNEVEKSEKRINSQLSRELNIAIPKELSKDQQIELIRNFAKEQFVAKGMIADLAMHNLVGENPHAHIMLTTREIGPEGFTRKNREWNDRELLKDWRKEWAEQTNQALEKAGVQERIDHRSLKDRGSKQIPQIHVGVHATAIERRGIHTELGDINRGIIELNAERDKFNTEKRSLIQEEKQYLTEVKAYEEIRDEPIKSRVIKQYSKEFPAIRHISEKTAISINALNTENDQPLSIKAIKKAYIIAGKNLEANQTDANIETFDKYKNVVEGLKGAQYSEKNELAKEKALLNPSRSKSRDMEMYDD